MNHEISNQRLCTECACYKSCDFRVGLNKIEKNLCDNIASLCVYYLTEEQALHRGGECG